MVKGRTREGSDPELVAVLRRIEERLGNLEALSRMASHGVDGLQPRRRCL